MAQRKRGFGSVRKLPSGRFQARYPGPDGILRSAPDTFATMKAADEWLAEARTQLRSGTWRDPSLGSVTLRDYALRWLGSRSDLKPRTRREYASKLDRHILPALGHLPLQKISPMIVREWHATLQPICSPTCDHDHPTARKHAYDLLRTIMGSAVADGYISEQPCRIPKASKVARPERPHPSFEEIQLIADKMPERYRAMVLMAAFGGFRFGEIIALKRSDLDMEALTATVSRTLHRMPGQWIETTPKSEAGTRTRFLPPHLREEIQSHLDTYVANRPSARIFTTRNGTHPSPGDFGKTFKLAVHKALGRTDIHFHDLRHAAAVMAAQSGATTKDLMGMLGHASPRAALLYQHTAEDRQKQIAEAISEAVAQGGNVIALGSRNRKGA